MTVTRGPLPPGGTGRLVVLALDPVLVPAGFQEGQHGDDDAGDVQVIFCAAHDDFSRRHSRLPQASEQEGGGACVDLVVDVSADGSLDRLDLEGTSLASTLLQVGLVAEGEAVERLRGRPVAEALPVIVAALQRLFDDAD